MKMGSKWKAGLIIAVVCLSLYFIVTKSISPGIDIAGGTHFIIDVLVRDLPKDERIDAVDQTVALYRKRIDKIGLAGTTVQPSGDSRIIVQIPGIDSKEANRIKEILQRQGHLEFKLVVDGPFDPI